MKRGTQHRRGGFTLIELLVVIAIIAILAGILFPVFLGAKSMAKTSACQSNLKQFVFAYKMYAEDFNGMFPFLPGQDQKYLHYTQEVLFFQGYLRSRATYHCPSDSSHPNNQKFYDEFGADGKMKWGINRDHSLSYLPYLYLPGRAHVNSDPWNILMSDANGTWQQPVLHRTGANVAYVGGHCIWYKLGDPWVDNEICKWGWNGWKHR